MMTMLLAFAAMLVLSIGLAGAIIYVLAAVAAGAVSEGRRG